MGRFSVEIPSQTGSDLEKFNNPAAKRNRPSQCRTFFRGGDVLVVTKLDRLAHSTAELLTIGADLSKGGIGLILLSMGREGLDTRNPTSEIMLTILAGVATWERKIMLERQRQGIAAAKAESKYKGRPVTIQTEEVRKLQRKSVQPRRRSR